MTTEDYKNIRHYIDGEKTIYICDKCDYKCNFISQWNNHIKTELHKTGKRKTRTNKKKLINVII